MVLSWCHRSRAMAAFALVLVLAAFTLLNAWRETTKHRRLTVELPSSTRVVSSRCDALSDTVASFWTDVAPGLRNAFPLAGAAVFDSAPSPFVQKLRRYHEQIRCLGLTGSGKLKLRVALVQGKGAMGALVREGVVARDMMNQSVAHMNGCGITHAVLMANQRLFFDIETKTETLDSAMNEVLYHCGSVSHKSVRCMNKMFLGLIDRWRADVVTLPQRELGAQKNKGDCAAVLAKYDVLVIADSFAGVPFLTNYLKSHGVRKDTLRSGQLRLWMPTEPGVLHSNSRSQAWNDRWEKELVAVAEWPICPVLLDLFSLPRDSWHLHASEADAVDSVPLIVPYDSRKWRAAFRPAASGKNRAVVHVVKQNGGTLHAQILRDLASLNLTHRMTAPIGTFGQFMRSLSMAYVQVLPDIHRWSFGQAMVDAAIFGTPSFSFQYRTFARLQPSFFTFNTSGELKEKLEWMMTHPESYEAMTEATLAGLELADTDNLPSVEYLAHLIHGLPAGNHSACQLPQQFTFSV